MRRQAVIAIYAECQRLQSVWGITGGNIARAAGKTRAAYQQALQRGRTVEGAEAWLAATRAACLRVAASRIFRARQRAEQLKAEATDAERILRTLEADAAALKRITGWKISGDIDDATARELEDLLNAAAPQIAPGHGAGDEE